MCYVFIKAKPCGDISPIHGRGNKAAELALIKLFRQHGIRGWRRDQAVFGKPDVVFRKARVAVFVDGCLWHGCLKQCHPPTNNHAFWSKKPAANARRDRQVNRILKQQGWRVLRLWQHDLCDREQACMRKLQAALNSSRLATEILQ